jgi:RNA polymerase sigma factor (sigma-70 family)
MTKTDFSDLVKKLSHRLYGYAFRILRNQEEAEDAVQEIFIRLWKMEGKLHECISIEALATTMIKNYSIDQFRKSKLRPVEEQGSGNILVLTSPSPHEQLEHIESNDIIFKIIDKLPDSYKTLIKLRDIEGYSYEEIAEKTDQNINNLRVTLSRARKIIRDEYNKYQYEHRGIKQVVGKVL